MVKKTLKEYLEVKNHTEALQYIEDLKEDKLSECTIKTINSIILDGIDRNNAGKYSQIDVEINGALHLATLSYLVSDKMSELLQWYNAKNPTIDRIIEFTCGFVNIILLLTVTENLKVFN